MQRFDFCHGMPLMVRAEDAEALRKDAERYQLLRRGQHWSVIDGLGDTLRADALDAAIDAKLALHNAKFSGGR